MVKIGLEIHAYLNTTEKLFCNCKSEHTNKEVKPNTNICPICTGQPGSKPMLPNKVAIDKIIEIGHVLNCKINKELAWQRKHYSWPDLPKGYQNTISGPHATENASKGKFLGIGITEIHLEEDPASWNPDTGEIDYNRSGAPLVEIVTDPDFKSAEEVTNWLNGLLATLSYIKAIDKSAGIKSDVNVSIPGGKRIELKNINSLTNIHNSIIVEEARQKGNVPKEQETRKYDAEKGMTILMRSKEDAADYKFVKDPDLPKIIIKKKLIKELKDNLPETPFEKLEKLIKKHNIDKKSATTLTKKLEIVEFFEKVIKEIPKEIAIPWTTIELLGVLNHNDKELEEVKIDHKHFIELLKLVESNKLTTLKAKDILRQFVPESFSPKKLAKENEAISNIDEIGQIAEQVIVENKKAVDDYKNGNKSAINFLIGQVMRLTDKRADYVTAKKVLEEILKD
jgi:aspartyl-tRNA(Asn)/glutamyl-tRNA(Gln) amidotransferase subunit B